ncbi:MAG: protease [Clostridia bacterium]|jgi:membrane protease YdiL (CAAX protease family)|nr:protease [Clostridia bacterium]
MKSQFVIILLIAGLNIPVYLELYKHALKSKATWFKVVITCLFWGVAIVTQNIAAFGGILYLYLAFYRHIRKEENDDVDIWHINASDSLRAVFMTVLGRIGIGMIHFIYIIILVKIVKYNIQLQDIINYYSEAKLIFKIFLAFEIVLVAPVVEEYVFRYFLYDKILAPKMPLFFAALFSAALFTIVHFNIAGIPTFFGLGLLCTYLYQKKGYWAAVIVHSASNLISLLFI